MEREKLDRMIQSLYTTGRLYVELMEQGAVAKLFDSGLGTKNTSMLVVKTNEGYVAVPGNHAKIIKNEVGKLTAEMANEIDKLIQEQEHELNLLKDIRDSQRLRRLFV